MMQEPSVLLVPLLWVVPVMQHLRPAMRLLHSPRLLRQSSISGKDGNELVSGVGNELKSCISQQTT